MRVVVVIRTMDVFGNYRVSSVNKCPIPEAQEGNCNKTRGVLCRPAEAGSYHLLRSLPRICAPSLPNGGHKHCKVFWDHEGPMTQRIWQVIEGRVQRAHLSPFRGISPTTSIANILFAPN